MDEGSYQKLVARAANGNQAAAQFLTAIVEVAHVWDDLIDRDRGVSNDVINDAFQTLLLDLPLNPFYRENLGPLNVLLHNSIRNWHLANSIERSNEEMLLPAAFVLRSAYADIFAHVAYITGGAELAVTVGLEARRQAHSEGFNGYLVNLSVERAARGN